MFTREKFRSFFERVWMNPIFVHCSANMVRMDLFIRHVTNWQNIGQLIKNYSFMCTRFIAQYSNVVDEFDDLADVRQLDAEL
jgi:hypothetical protein